MDPSFNGGNAFIYTIGTGGPPILDRVGAVTFDSTGRIYLGAAQQASSTSRDPAVVRLAANGTIDTSCGNAGVISANFGGMGILPASVLFRDSHNGIWVGTADSTLLAYDFDASTCTASTSPGPLVSGAKGGFSAVASDGAVYVSYTQATTPYASQILALHDGLAYTGLAILHLFIPTELRRRHRAVGRATTPGNPAMRQRLRQRQHRKLRFCGGSISERPDLLRKFRRRCAQLMLLLDQLLAAKHPQAFAHQQSFDAFVRSGAIATDATRPRADRRDRPLADSDFHRKDGILG